MPLPPALLARLQKRGIVKHEEEVIAENYEAESSNKNFEENAAGAPGCPNKYNPFHVCVEYCYDHWGDGTAEYQLPESYIMKKNRMLVKFPLPDGWVEVYDAGVAKFYFWNKFTDEVCWLSPRHPRAIISDPAPKIARENYITEKEDRKESRSRDDKRRRRDDENREKGSDRRRESSNRWDRDSRRRKAEDAEDSGNEDDMTDRDRLKRAKRKGIDPMDPAAYGDAPVGKWSDGLRVEAVTGADVTASGPLFQQRPYPAPGAILRKQQGTKGDD